jgi:hypothetical protein
MNIQSQPPASSAFVKPTSLICGTMVTTDLKRVRHMLEEGFGLHCVQPAQGLLLARDRGHEIGGAKRGEPYWVLEIREKSEVPVAQEMLNHWGMAAPSQAAVDEAFEKLGARKEDYGILRVQKPRFRNGSYACYFVDRDSNWWELEYRSPDLTYEVLRAAGDLHHD